MATKAPPELSPLDRYRLERDTAEMAAHDVATETQLAAETAAADLLRRQLEFTADVMSAPPRNQEKIDAADQLRTDVVTALRTHIAALAGFNSRVNETAALARLLDLVDDRDAAVTWVSSGVFHGLHIDDARVEAARGWQSAAQTILAAAINIAVRSTR